MGVKIAKKDDEFKLFDRVDDIYSDFNQNFLPHPNTGQISRKINIDAVKLALRNLILTNKYERLRNPDFGTNIRKYLFERFDGNIEMELKIEIEDAVQKYEPRVRILDIDIDQQPDDNAIYIKIEFSINTIKETQFLDLVLYRVR